MKMITTLTAMLLFMLGIQFSTLQAQDTINYLIISEFRGDKANMSYLELTNKGDIPVALNKFKIGYWGGGSTLIDGQTNMPDYWIPTSVSLAPGESFLLAAVAEYGPMKFKEGVTTYPEKQTQNNVLIEADLRIYLPEQKSDPKDIVTPEIYTPFDMQWNGKGGFYLEYHFPNGDSIVVDQIGGTAYDFTLPGMSRPPLITNGYDVAGVTEATRTCYLIRKNSVTKGNLDFNSGRGTNLENSEWIPIPIRGGAWRLAPWTIGNQGDYNLTASTLQSDKISVDFANKKLTVPWGVGRGDDIMNYFTQKPGIGWEYIVGPSDSASFAVHTGDKLVIYVCGNDLDVDTFDIVASEPADDATKILVQSNTDRDVWRSDHENGIMNWPRIKYSNSGMDTIWGYKGGIPYATRIDSLFECLDKPANATWKIVFKSGITRPDLKNGDILKITAIDNSTKEYYISVKPYEPNNNAQLSMITWPDIPDYMKGLFGWLGDTIPNFNSGVYNYYVTIPSFLGDGIPALSYRTADINATVETIRAKGFNGSIEDRTITFKVTAEDNSSVRTYRITLIKELDPECILPYKAEPYIAQITKNVLWSGNDYMEIYNPGTQPIDLSYYMIVGQTGTDADAGISKTNASNWMRRYEKYIPGRKWGTEDTWAGSEYKAITDLSVNKMLAPGDVFTMAEVHGEHSWESNYVWPSATQVDVHFWSYTSAHFNLPNKWGEVIAESSTPFSNWQNDGIYLYKIIGDSVREGLKPATDPKDFQLIDVVGGTGSLWELNKYISPAVDLGNPFTLIRKPWVQKGNTAPGKSFGFGQDSIEWLHYNNTIGAAQGLTQKQHEADLGKHYALPYTGYLSTISSTNYKISKGYTLEEIKGITSGSTAKQFLERITKADVGQTLNIIKSKGDTIKVLTTLVENNDTLVVVSADKKNMTKYGLNVTVDGLSKDALVSSSWYKVTILKEPTDTSIGEATITEIPVGTRLIDVITSRINYPEGCSKEVYNSKGDYLPFKILNYDTTYVDVTVNSNMYISVTSENGLRTIRYQLIIDSSPNDTYVTSNLYKVNDYYDDLFIMYVPAGTNVKTFLSNLVPATGATIKIYDKLGYERVDGLIYIDDKIIVTSADSSYKKLYFLKPYQYPCISGCCSDYLGLRSDYYRINNIEGVVEVEVATSIETFKNNTSISKCSSMKIYDSNNVERTSCFLLEGDKVVVTSLDMKLVISYKVKYYYPLCLCISNKSKQLFHPKIYYVSYLDNVVLINKETSVEDFKLNANPGSCLTMKISSKSVEKNTGLLMDGDYVSLYTLDSRFAESYRIVLFYSNVNDLKNINIDISPNPTRDIINVAGLKPGQTIQVLNTFGKLLNTTIVKESTETIKLNSYPAGIYIINVSDNNQAIGRYKIVKN